MIVTCLRLLHNHLVGSMTMWLLLFNRNSASVSPSLRSFRDQFMDLNIIRSKIFGGENLDPLTGPPKHITHWTSCRSNMLPENSNG